MKLETKLAAFIWELLSADPWNLIPPSHFRAHQQNTTYFMLQFSIFYQGWEQQRRGGIDNEIKDNKEEELFKGIKVLCFKCFTS